MTNNVCLCQEFSCPESFANFAKWPFYAKLNSVSCYQWEFYALSRVWLILNVNLRFDQFTSQLLFKSCYMLHEFLQYLSNFANKEIHVYFWTQNDLTLYKTVSTVISNCVKNIV